MTDPGMIENRTLDEIAIGENDPVISAGNSPVTVRVIPTDEERMIAIHASAMLDQASRPHEREDHD